MLLDQHPAKDGPAESAKSVMDALEEALEVATEIQFAQVVLRFRDTEASNG